MHYVKGHTHVAFNGNYGPFFNKLTFSLAHFGMITTIRMGKKWVKIRNKFSRKGILDMLKYNKSIYTISPSLFSRPDYWPKNLNVLGYHLREKIIKWQPSNALNDFIEKSLCVLFYPPRKIIYKR
jgi:hypothetical protein